ncbi:FAD-dependent oxidoreductase [Aquabacterium sp.]|uniref:FAD-dependent oxidoreductase n=1 Tax=Aquabacterium sp. TaxID=1872578 RepID=UPI002C2269F9|nr:FAD-dependent oxidoreductase [Aquabacterium sp.]HSW07874.1 FAD-dependent oxidoreductase [Aquabacterium sp.]
MNRREAMLAGAALLAGCGDRAATAAPAEWVGASHERGHRLRTLRSGALPAPARQRRCDVLIVGGGIAGLASARALARAGIHDIALLELEDQAGGNSRGHTLAGQRCPLGAHYLPMPDEAGTEVSEFLHQLGLLSSQLGRTVAEERYLCHSPQERLFFEGAWHEGLLPPAAPGSATQIQYRAFAAATARVQRELGFAMPSLRAPWTAGHGALDAQTFAHWLNGHGLDDARLRWYLDYACRDDYGAGLDQVSAWAGLHYFASRHGFHAPGDDAGERDAVFTWPEGNAWLAERLAAPLRDRMQGGRVVLRVDLQRDGVQALAWSAATGETEAWSARAVVMATPLFIAARLLSSVPPALSELVPRMPQAPWLVANLRLREALLDRGIGAPAAWDNVAYGAPSLGYVDAGHQRLSPLPGPTVLTAYWALPQAQRQPLLDGEAAAWAARVVADIAALHPDLPHKLERISLMRYGHAMSIPVPGLRSSPALAALAQMAGRLQFAHSDLSAYSVFEEAFTHGDRAGRGAAAWLRR